MTITNKDTNLKLYVGEHILIHYRSSKALAPNKPWVRGAATLNVNEWFKYFNVRSNPIDLVAGNEYIVKIKPTQHSASPEIRSVDPDKRNCRFEDEGASIKTKVNTVVTSLISN